MKIKQWQSACSLADKTNIKMPRVIKSRIINIKQKTNDNETKIGAKKTKENKRLCHKHSNDAWAGYGKKSCCVIDICF